LEQPQVRDRSPLIWGTALDGEDAEGDRVWMTCSCGAVLVRVAPFD
jgi:hypothetical protein